MSISLKFPFRLKHKAFLCLEHKTLSSKTKIYKIKKYFERLCIYNCFTYIYKHNWDFKNCSNND